MLRTVTALVCLSLALPVRADAGKGIAPDLVAAEPPHDPAEIIRDARRDIDAWARELLSSEDSVDDDPLPAVAVDVLPPSLSSSAPGWSPLPIPAPEEPEVEWLRGLRLPDLPIRWDARLVELLTHYRDDDRGRANLQALVARSGRYEAMVRRTFREAGLPEDLLYVAMVESGYDPTAKSPAGAVGMWQFVESTGGDYGLDTTRWVDERMSVEASTQAAARFMRDLYGKLGSWPLALAAFNMGYGAMLRSIRKYNTNDFWLLSRLEAGLPYETIAYVTKVMAYAVIAHNPERFGLADLTKEPALDTVLVKVPGGTGLGRLARAAGMSLEELTELNPELRRQRIPPDVKEFPLRLPGDRVERFRKRWPEIEPRTGSHAFHILRFGERLRDVAELYDTSETKLRRLNELAPDEQVAPGRRLLVPDVEPEPAEPADPPVVGVPETTFDYGDRRHVFYRVIDGDTVQDVAAFFRCTVDELRTWNDISTDAALVSGMYLQLYVPAGVDLARAMVLQPSQVRPLVVGSVDFFDYHESQRERVRIRYRVKRGDSLQSLASRYDLSVGSIARINGFSRYSQPEPNSEIILYVPEASAKKAKKR